MKNRTLAAIIGCTLVVSLSLRVPWRTVPFASLTERFFPARHNSFFVGADLSSASATLSNPRLSYQAAVGAVAAGGATVITIGTGASNGDRNTKHLFPNDAVRIGSNTGLEVQSVLDDTSFVIKSGLSSGVNTSDFVYGIQSGTMTVNFYTGSAIPANGSVSIVIPDPDGTVSGSRNDGLPDTATNASLNGFDLNSITGTDITCPAGFTAGTLTAGTGSGHTVTCNLGASSLPAGANLTVVIGTPSRGLVNPAPVSSGHNQGQADIYTITASTTTAANGGGSTVESVAVRVAPVEGVLISATIDETLSFSVAGVANITTTCGFTPSGTNLSTTDPTAIPFGNNIVSSAFYNAAQTVTISTNARSGYAVRIEENDQMGKDGGVCNSPGDHTADETGNCIKDTTCDAGGCTESTSAEWNTASNTGLGFTLVNVASADATFLRNESGRTFSARQIADQQGSTPETKQAIMQATAPRSNSEICIVYRLSVPGTQPAGTYFNKVRYTATTLF